MLVQAVSAVVTTHRAKKYQARLTGALLAGRFQRHGPRTPAPSVVPIQCKELAVSRTIKMARVRGYAGIGDCPGSKLVRRSRQLSPPRRRRGARRIAA